MSYILLEQPYTSTQIKAIQNTAGDTSGIVAVDLTEVIDNDLESFLDILEERLIGDAGVLTDVEYKVVGNGINGYDLHIYVCGIVNLLDGDD